MWIGLLEMTDVSDRHRIRWQQLHIVGKF